MKIPYHNEETPFEIRCEEDWKKVKNKWYVSYICNTCGEKHVKKVDIRCAKNTCKRIPYRNEETPFEIQSEEDWKKVKHGWYVSYICNTCGEKHVKIISDLDYAKNTCTNKMPHYKKEIPFEIQSEEDWKKIKKQWYVSYICNKCGKRHVKKVSKSKSAKNTCTNKMPHYKKEIPFEIQSEEDWKKVKTGWYVSYICNKCGKRHVKKVSRLICAKNTCLNKNTNNIQGEILCL